MQPQAKDPSVKIGVIAIQGDFDEHLSHFKALPGGVEAYKIKNLGDLSARKYNGLVFPGGESTTHRTVLASDKALYEGLYKLIFEEKIPVWGTCCGLLLLAKKVDGKDQNASEDKCFPCLDVDALRNVYGSHCSSFSGKVQFDNTLRGTTETIDGIFIRAPAINSAQSNVKVIAKLEDKHKFPIVGVKQDNILGTCFHPELTEDTRFHEYFAEFASRYHPIKK